MVDAKRHPTFPDFSQSREISNIFTCSFSTFSI